MGVLLGDGLVAQFAALAGGRRPGRALEKPLGAGRQGLGCVAGGADEATETLRAVVGAHWGLRPIEIETPPPFAAAPPGAGRRLNSTGTALPTVRLIGGSSYSMPVASGAISMMAFSIACLAPAREVPQLSALPSMRRWTTPSSSRPSSSTVALPRYRRTFSSASLMR